MQFRVGVSPWEAFRTIGGALLGAAAFPPLGLWPLALVSVALFIWVIRDCNSAQARPIGLLYGLTFGLGTMYWLFGLFGLYAITLIALMAGYFGILATLIGMTKWQHPLLRAALIALFAVGIEWLRGDAWYLRFPWYTAPHALAQAPAWIAPVRWLGTYGFSYFIWLIVASGVLYRSSIWLAVFLFPATSLLLWPIDQPDRVALLIQVEDHVDAERLIAQQVAAARDDEGMTAKAVLNRKPDLVVFPEYAFPFALEKALESRRGPTILARTLKSPLVFGTVLGEYGEPGFQNVAAVLDEEGRLLETFPKQRPVPLMLDGKPAERMPVIKVREGTLGVALCYDFDASEIAGRLVERGATILILPTGDLMTWGRVQHLHHELLLRLRAVENDRWILRATSSGRTEVVDPHGVPSPEGIEIGDTGYMRAAFAHRSGIALGGQTYLLGPLAMGLTAAVTLIYGVSYLQRRRKASQSVSA